MAVKYAATLAERECEGLDILKDVIKRIEKQEIVPEVCGQIICQLINIFLRFPPSIHFESVKNG